MLDSVHKTSANVLQEPNRTPAGASVNIPLARHVCASTIFRAHRDNTTKGTEHRRFTVSINLNAEFEGGGLTA
jgi:hypothetical protein